jgi:hypothetical protein
MINLPHPITHLSRIDLGDGLIAEIGSSELYRPPIAMSVQRHQFPEKFPEDLTLGVCCTKYTHTLPHLPFVGDSRLILRQTCNHAVTFISIA